MAQFRRQADAGDGEDLVDPLEVEDATGDTGGDLFEAAGEWLHFDALRAMIDGDSGRILAPEQLDEAARLAIGRGATGASIAGWARAFRRRARHAGRAPVFEDLLAEIGP